MRELLITQRAVKVGGGCSESHRNFRRVHRRDNEPSLDGNMDRRGFELRHLTPIK